MSVVCTYEEGTSLVLDEETIQAKPGWTVDGTLTRLGNGVCVLTAKISNAARAAWDKEVTYAKGQLATEGGSTYQSLADANINHKPSASPAQWSKLTEEKAVCALPAEFAPAPTNNVIEATYSLVEGSTKRLQLVYAPSETTIIDPSGNFELFND